MFVACKPLKIDGQQLNPGDEIPGFSSWNEVAKRANLNLGWVKEVDADGKDMVPQTKPYNVPRSYSTMHASALGESEGSAEELDEETPDETPEELPKKVAAPKKKATAKPKAKKAKKVKPAKAPAPEQLQPQE